MMYTPFFTPIWCKSINIDIDSIAEKCLRIEQEFPGNVISNEGGYQSPNISIEEHLPLLGDAMHSPMSEVVNEASLSLALAESWININRMGHYNTAHVHPNNVLSAVIYIRTPKDSGEIFFENPTPAVHYPIDSSKEIFNGNFWIQPKPGDMLIFPSYLRHYVGMNKSNDPRISIALNFR
jgi:uncharacterized protein (TIGR02466 family)